MPSSTFLYDDQCAFCVHWISYWKELVTDVEFVSLSDGSHNFQQRIGKKYGTSVHYITDTSISLGAEAVFRLLSHSPRRTYWLWLYQHSKTFSSLTESGYKQLSSCRDCGASFTKLLWPNTRPPLFLIDCLLPWHTYFTHAIRFTLASFLFVWGAQLIGNHEELKTISAILLLSGSPLLLFPRNLRRIGLALISLSSVTLLFSSGTYLFLLPLLSVLLFLNLSRFTQNTP